MSANRFDAVLRSLSTGASRRGIFAGVTAGVLVALPRALGVEQVAAKGKGKKRQEEAWQPATNLRSTMPRDRHLLCLSPGRVDALFRQLH